MDLLVFSKEKRTPIQPSKSAHISAVIMHTTLGNQPGMFIAHPLERLVLLAN